MVGNSKLPCSELVLIHRNTTPLFCVTQSPISCLPTELLTEIFLCVRDVYLTGSSLSRRVLPICHVCAHWRNVATHYSPLWTVIDDSITHPALMAVFLTNSKVAKLNLNLALRALCDAETMRLVMNALHRVEDLTIKPDLDETVTQALALSTCWNPGYPASSLQAFTIASSTIPDDFFTTATFPALQHLFIRFSFFKVKALPCDQLVTLQLQHPVCDIVIWDLLDQLRRAPRLEDLELYSAFDVPVEQVTTTRAANPVQLDALSNLHIHTMSWKSIITFLNHVSVPSDAFVCAEPEDGDQRDSELVIAATFQCRNESKFPEIRRFCLDIGSYEASFDVTKAEDYQRFDTPNSSTITFLGYDPVFVDAMPLAQLILQRHNLSYLTTLDITCSTQRREFDFESPGFDACKIWELTHQLYTIRTIKARHIFALSFVNFLGLSVKKTMKTMVEFINQKSPLIKDDTHCLVEMLRDSNFFGLKELALDFRQCRWGLSGPPKTLCIGSKAKADFKRFRDGLKFRKMCHLCLGTLELAGVDGCDLEVELRLLEKVVGKVKYLDRAN